MLWGMGLLEPIKKVVLCNGIEDPLASQTAESINEFIQHALICMERENKMDQSEGYESPRRQARIEVRTILTTFVLLWKRDSINSLGSKSHRVIS